MHIPHPFLHSCESSPGAGNLHLSPNYSPQAAFPATTEREYVKQLAKPPTEVAPMTTKFKLHETLENAFIAGLLLTGSIEQAEAAILESVRMTCPDDLFGETLFRRAVHYAIDPQIRVSGQQQKEVERAASILPFELRCVLKLSKNLRYCYVLRVLVGLPREVCAWLLHLDTAQVEERTCAAMLELPLIQQREYPGQDGSRKKLVIDRPNISSNARRLPRTRKPYRPHSAVTFFTSTKIIEFNKPIENS